MRVPLYNQTSKFVAPGTTPNKVYLIFDCVQPSINKWTSEICTKLILSDSEDTFVPVLSHSRIVDDIIRSWIMQCITTGFSSRQTLQLQVRRLCYWAKLCLVTLRGFMWNYMFACTCCFWYYIATGFCIVVTEENPMHYVFI